MTLGPFDKMTFNVGGSMDDPKDSHLTPGGRSQNSYIFGNMFYKLSKAVVIGVEVSRWETTYKDGDSWDSIRAQTAFLFKI